MFVDDDDDDDDVHDVHDVHDDDCTTLFLDWIIGIIVPTMYLLLPNSK